MLSSLPGRRVSVIGLGREGVDLTRFLVSEGARVLVTDTRPAEHLTAELGGLAGLEVEFTLGGHPAERVLNAELLFVSPGIPPEVPVLEEARARGIPISSATELFFDRCPVPIIGITGSSGKSTTTALTGEILAAAGRHVVVGGNIGYPLLGRLAELRRDSLVVMELSSFQLESLDRSPHLATITNITANHLDRHGTMDVYIAAKERIFRFQQGNDWTVLNADDPVSRDLRPPAQLARFSLEGTVEQGAYLDGGTLRLALDGQPDSICAATEIALRGRHNLANALTACATSGLVGAEPHAMRAALAAFRGLPHRLQKVGVIDGVTYYDDSIATSPERSMAALAAYDEPIILLAGGRDKHLPMDQWAAVIRDRVKATVLFGEAAGLIRAELDRAGYDSGRIREVGTIGEAVRAARDGAVSGDVVLLSPGCTSYDMFRDFVERGNAFAASVRELAGGPR